jgi:hypothetical protein
MDTAVDPHAEVDRPLWRAPALIGAGVAAGCAAIAMVNPTDSGVPICWSQAAFGIDCPLCGGLRCTNALLRGDLAAAADHNVLLAVVLPVIAVLWAVWLYRSLRGESFRLPSVPRWVIGVAAVTVLAFSVARNLDASGWIGWLGSTA